MTQLEVRGSIDELLGDAVASIGAELSALTAEQDRVDLAIAGGFVAERFLPALASVAGGVDWSRVEVWWVDERYVPVGSPDRNDAAAIDALLGELPGVRLHAMPADEGAPLEEAAASFAAEWASAMSGRRLDLVLLGMGPDGHVASLFPGRVLPEDREILAVDNSPKPPPRRLTVTMRVLRDARRVHLLAAGASKAAALARAVGELAAPVLPDDALPIARALAGDSVAWLDAEAAHLLD